MNRALLPYIFSQHANKTSNFFEIFFLFFFLTILIYDLNNLFLDEAAMFNPALLNSSFCSASCSAIS
jgi:hypothetical protein